MLLQLASWPEVEAYLQTKKVIVIPIGSTEQHGPNGLIGTDAICPEVIAKEVGKREQILVAPTLSIGMAQHHLGFAGSITFKPSTLMAVVCDVVNSLAVHGFEQFYFLNGHGGNIATVTAAFSELYAETSLGTVSSDRPRLQCTLKNWWQGQAVAKVSKELFPKGEGAHATPSEVSLTYYAYPEAVKNVSMSPKIAPYGEIRDAADYRRQFPDGRIGSDPSQASAAAGERLFKASVSDIIEDVTAFINKSD